MENRPHSRDKKVGSGSAFVEKGEKYSSSQVGAGGREGSYKKTGEKRDVQRGNGLSTGLLLLFFARIFGSLPPKVRKIVLVVVAVVLIFTMLRSCMPMINNVTPSVPQQQGQTTPSSIPEPEPEPEPESSSSVKPGLDPGISNNPSSPSPQVTPGTARNHYYTPKGNGKDSVTIMIYMCGTDLESKYGMGTNDLIEMTKANLSDNVNIIVETGGCKKWQNNAMSSSTNQIWKVNKGNVSLLEDNLGNLTMTDPLTLTSFINYCSKNYKADRNILIMWDHGGGSITGYGYDEKHSSAGSMDLAEFNSALKAAGVKFDWIGFDACLMQTLETAMVCDSYADYLIASEESEPGTGWYYTNWLTTLSNNTSIDTVTLSKQLIDDFVSTSLRQSSKAAVTLSIIDLAEMEGTIPQYFTEFSRSTNDLVSSNNYRVVSDARANTRQFAQSQKLNQIDLIDFADRLGTTEATNLAKLLKSCIKYNKTNISRANGVSIYFPYENLRSMNTALNTYSQIGFDDTYTKCITNFASLASSGQMGYSSGYSSHGGNGSIDLYGLLGGGSPLESLLGGYSNSSGGYSSGYEIDPSLIYQLLSSYTGRGIPEDYSWIDSDVVKNNARYVSQNIIDPSHITPTISANGKSVVSLTDDEWGLIQSVQLNVFVDDGEGFIDLGRDNVFSIEGNDLLLDYDNTWLTVNGKVVAYYMESDILNQDGTWVTTGVIPALLTSKDPSGTKVTQRVNLEVVFDSENPEGVITGARPVYPDGDTESVAKGNIEILENDVIQFLCDYYDYDGGFSASYSLGKEPLVVPASGLKLENLNISNTEFSVTYLLTDIYGNKYWTPAFTSNS
ncbi:MAG: peptidase C11 [Oscillospiraceae bacterium]|nr:peptidase C11 [Oscillospiraceae bacterium]